MTSPETSVTTKTATETETETSNNTDDQAAKCYIENTVESIRCLLVTLMCALVDYPHAVSINVVEGAQAVIYEVNVHPEDVRRIVGRKGRTADATRELLTNLGGKAGRRFLLEIVEPKERWLRSTKPT